jgi:hypothetical protein
MTLVPKAMQSRRPFETIHSLAEQRGDKSQPTVTTTCGLRYIRSPFGGLPLDVTSWGSEVTCDDCLNHRRVHEAG